MVATISLTPKANVKHHELIFARQHFEASELSRPAIKQGAAIITFVCKAQSRQWLGTNLQNDLVAECNWGAGRGVDSVSVGEAGDGDRLEISITCSRHL